MAIVGGRNSDSDSDSDSDSEFGFLTQSRKESQSDAETFLESFQFFSNLIIIKISQGLKLAENVSATLCDPLRLCVKIPKDLNPHGLELAENVSALLCDPLRLCVKIPSLPNLRTHPL